MNGARSADCPSLLFHPLDPCSLHFPRQPLSQETLKNFCNKSLEYITTRDFNYILLLLSSLERKPRGEFGIYMRLMKETDAVSLAPSELTESKISFLCSMLVGDLLLLLSSSF